MFCNSGHLECLDSHDVDTGACPCECHLIGGAVDAALEHLEEWAESWK